MTGQTMAEKILASRADSASVSPGDHVTVQPDLVLAHDLSAPRGKKRMAELGFESVAIPERVVIVFDHYVPSSSARMSTLMREVEAWIESQGIEHFVPAGEGISHNVLTERGYSVPGTVLVGSDSHTTTHGAFGTFATGIGHTDLGYVMGTGELWLRVPETQKLLVEGTIPAGCAAKDLALAIMGELTARGAIYDALEYHGPVIRELAMHERSTISNLAVELGAMAGMIPPDATTEAYLEDRARIDGEAVHPDPNAAYSTEHRIDADELEPLVAEPSRVDNVGTVRENEGTSVDQVFVGTCNNARYEDIREFADLIDGEEFAPGTDVIVVPGSKRALQAMNRDGISNDIMAAGGMIGTPGCGPCFGAHGGILGEGETCVGTMNRNFPGRMGPGEIYLSSPKTAAAAALYGELTDPREVI